MILTVTLNAAIDVTYRVERFFPGSVMRVAHVHERAGGKGVNVGRVLAAIGVPVCATGLAGGRRGEAIRAELTRLGIREEFEPIAAESRQTVVVTDGRGHPTEFDEPGPEVAHAEWDRFQQRFARLVRDAGVVVLAGSLPPGLPVDAYAQLTAAARRAGTAVIVDAGGPALRLACGAGPDIVKPNHLELAGAAAASSADDGSTVRSREGGLDAHGPDRREAARRDGAAGEPDGPRPDGTGRGGLSGRVAAALAAAGRLRGLGAGAVVASMGSDGGVAVTADGRWGVSHPRITGNPVGAGDALAAGLAAGLLEGRSWPEMLASATGLAMASVTRPWAGDVDAVEAAELAASVHLRRIGAP